MRLRSLCLVLLMVGSVAAPSVAGVATATEPTVEITAGSTSVADGDTYRTGSDVEMTVNASVAAGAPTGTSLDEIVVRVNGEHAESIAVNGSTASETVEPELSNGNNSVRVIVTDDAGSVNSTAFTVTKDTEAPHVYLTSPYQSAPWKPIDDGEANSTRSTIAGNVIDDSVVEKLRVTRTFDGDRATRVFRDVGENFSTEMLLGYSDDGNETNEFRLTATDEFGNVRIYTFSIDVTDDDGPTISLEPFPNETSRHRIDLAGAVEDSVGVRSANLTVTGPEGNVTKSTEIASPRTPRLDPDRLSVSFDEPIYTLYTGTYEAEVTVTDVAGETTTKTVSIDRVPREDRDLAPEIRVDRDRTVVLGPERLFLSGAAFEGVTERLVVETRNSETGDTIDYQVVHSGSRSERVEFDREVAIGENRTDVIVRATDPDGAEHTERFVVDGRTQETFVGENESGTDTASDDWPKVSVQSLQDGRTGTASGSVTIERGTADTTVSVPDSDGASDVVGTANVTLDRMAVDLAADANVTATVVVRERAGDALSAPDGATPAASVTVQHSVPDAAVDGATFDLTVRRAYLDAHGLDPSNLSVHRFSGENWSTIETVLVETNETHARYEVTSPGLSVFSLATDPALAESDGNGTDGGATNGPTGNETGTNETETNETAGEDGEATIFVTNVTVNRTEAAVNESVAVNVTLANDGDIEGSYTAGLQTVHGVNVTLQETKSVTVAPGEEETVGFTTQFAREGNHTVMVNGTQAGPVVVSQGGGLFSFLSVLSVLPLRLIGMGVGGLLGLGLVVVLLRFVLGKVGGDGDSAGG